MFQTLKVISLLSENSDSTCRQITQYLSKQLDIATDFIDNIDWREKHQLLDAQEVHLGWICGIDYVRKIDSKISPVDLVAAPVMKHPRYQQQPIYFSDVIVHRDSQYNAFEDLRGKSWGYNDVGSHSGYNLVQYHLAKLGETHGYFGKVIEAGTHLQAIEMVLEHRVDGAAIDSMVLDLELRTKPQLQSKLRVIENLGPSPIPPWVITRNVPSALRESIRQAFWNLHETPEGRSILEPEQMMKMVQVEDSNYDLIRDMKKVANQVVL
ncbi:phosphate/phosphite/phosphonate ABC transporter substrate-binding protein [Okeania sp. SIO2B3]|uniref:phosphate/phosphite/phosphonate ABC transporter substrate-binding protein n=1 Tax=Okeania sp. SIO2B3 TaxID=2607784 RepID=UPI0013BFF28E|nr:PhnD/SsuA/transferrin family substrate-binding protein [Okeania sp. SIO2B3]NET46690.1 PhnD/SsuA/transferrin family substrate-binding protein [Okeania sp. SIO2B3]